MYSVHRYSANKLIFFGDEMSRLFIGNGGLTRSHGLKLLGRFQWCVVEEFLDEVHMAKEHPSTAITFQSKCVEGIAAETNESRTISQECVKS